MINACALSFLAAFVDTAGFIALFGLFTAHVTGNFVLIGAALVHRDAEVIAKLLSLPMFMIAVALAFWCDRALRRRPGRSRATALLAGEAAVLGVALIALATMTPPAGADSPTSLVVGLILVFAMGLQNALMRLGLSSLPPTTVMTGNVTQAVLDCMILWTHDRDGEAEASKRLRRMVPLILCFTAGAAMAALGTATAGLHCLWLAVAIALALAWRYREVDRAEWVAKA